MSYNKQTFWKSGQFHCIHNQSTMQCIILYYAQKVKTYIHVHVDLRLYTITLTCSAVVEGAVERSSPMGRKEVNPV